MDILSYLVVPWPEKCGENYSVWLHALEKVNADNQKECIYFIAVNCNKIMECVPPIIKSIALSLLRPITDTNVTSTALLVQLEAILRNNTVSIATDDLCKTFNDMYKTQIPQNEMLYIYVAHNEKDWNSLYNYVLSEMLDVHK